MTTKLASLWLGRKTSIATRRHITCTITIGDAIKMGGDIGSSPMARGVMIATMLTSATRSARSTRGRMKALGAMEKATVGTTMARFEMGRDFLTGLTRTGTDAATADVSTTTTATWTSITVIKENMKDMTMKDMSMNIKDMNMNMTDTSMKDTSMKVMTMKALLIEPGID